MEFVFALISAITTGLFWIIVVVGAVAVIVIGLVIWLMTRPGTGATSPPESLFTTQLRAALRSGDMDGEIQRAIARNNQRTSVDRSRG